MISANINNKLRKQVYARDGYRCALCDDTRTIQIHHAVKRSLGGKDHEHNLITLCSNCHALAHGTNLQGWTDIDQEAIEQAIIEYLADYYAPNWNPYRKGAHPMEGDADMLTITIEVDAPSWMAQGVKEYAAMCLERFGDTRVVEVTQDEPEPLNEQMSMEGSGP